MARKKNLFDWSTPTGKVLSIISGLIVLSLGLPIFQSLKAWIQNLRLKASLNDVKNNYDYNNQKPNETKIISIVKSVIGKTGWYNDDEKGIVIEVNKLNGKDDALFASTYYQTQYNGSFKEFLQDKLKNDDWVDWLAQGQRFKDIRPDVREFLF